MSRTLIRGPLYVVLASSITLASPAASASGFAVREQSVEAMGSALAGAAAATYAPSAQFANPASLAWMRGNHASIAAFPIRPQIDVETESPSTTVLGTPIAGSARASADLAVFTGSLYVNHHLSPTLSLGLGITTPFGLAVDYPDAWAGRYYALDSKIETVDVNPALAWQVNNQLSVGLGISFQYSRTELSSAIDLGTLNALPTALGGFGNAFDALGLIPGDPGSDGRARFTGDGTGIGWNAGLQYRFDNGAHLGLAYRSDVHIRLDGKLDYDTPGDDLIPSATGLFRDTDANTSIRHPGHVSVSLAQPLDTRWTALVDVTWTHWSVLDEVVIHAENDTQPDNTIRVNWQDSLRYSLGLAYLASHTLTLRAGLSFDDGATRDDGPLTPAAPDGDRMIVTTGLSFTPDPSFGLDLAYHYMRFGNSDLKRSTDDPNDALLGNVNASYRNRAHIFGIQLRWNF